MSSQKQIQDELRSLESSLPSINNHPFSVPEGYFEGLPASVLAKIKAGESSVSIELQEISPFLVSIPRKMPYSVPFSYFAENLEGITGISAESESSILAPIGKTMPFSLPESYFDTFAGKLLNQIEQPKAKVIPLFARTWMRVASAAIIGGGMFLAGYQYFNKNQEISIANNTGDTTETLLASKAPRIEQDIKKVSTKELEEFIENVQVTKKQPVLSDNDKVKDLLKDVSDTEMETFLSALPTADEDVFVTD